MKSAAYNFSQYVVIEDLIDIEKLRDSICKAYHVHKALHTKFTFDGSTLLQTTKAILKPLIHEHQFVDLDREDSKVIEFLEDVDSTPLEILNGDCFRFGLIHLKNNVCIFYWSIHHLIIDGRGSESFIHTVAEFFNQTQSNRRIIEGWPQIIQQDLDYQKSSDLLEDDSYWFKRLKPITSPNSLSSNSGSSFGLIKAKKSSLFLSYKDYEKIIELSKKISGSSIAALISIASVYVFKLTQSSTACIGVPISARTKEQANIVGMASSILPVPLLINNNDSIENVIKNAANDLREGLRRSRFPLNKIVHARRLHNLGDPFSFVINLQKYKHRILFGNSWGEVFTQNTGPATDLILQIFDKCDGNDVEFRLEYNPELYKKHEIDEHLRNILQLVHSFLTATPHSLVSTLALVDAQERAQLIAQSAGPVQALDATLANLPDL
ncbi:condensation domain-containing protein, partial [Polynucleobacter sp.]|uniref:condensation domain-containing protein n=1 Tax=Polynucleobacter sp. TaxID=2029855 RepID=UPI0025F3D3EC